MSELPAPLPPLQPRVVAQAVARWWLVFLSALLFAALAAELRRSSSVWFDEPALRWLHTMRSATLTEAMLWTTRFGDGEVVAVIAVIVSIFLLWQRHPYSALFIAASAAGAGVLNHGLKLWFARPRPELPLQLVSTHGFAFPSGHSMGSAALYGALAIVIATRFPQGRLPAVLLCLGLVGVIGFSRSYLHVHYPSDVIAGWCLGFVWAAVLKPLVLGPGYSKNTIPAAELAEDGVTPES